MNTLIITQPEELEQIVTDAVNKAVSKKSQLKKGKKPSKEVFTNRQAMKFLNVSRSTLQRWREAGKLSYTKVENKILYRREDLEKLLEENRK